MGSRQKLVASLLIAALALVSPAASAATKKPSPKATSKVTAKATSKPTSKATYKATSKATSKATAKPTSKATATTNSTSKPKVTKKPVVRKVKKKRPKIRVTPSPKPSWPPQGFSVEGEVYAKVPTAQEQVGLISANASLAKQIKACTTFICGSVQVASETGCLWWEVISVISDGDGKKLGDLTSAFPKSNARDVKLLIVVSPENGDKGGSAKIGSVICHHEDRVTNDSTSTYKKVSG